MAAKRRPAQNYAVRHDKPKLSQDILEGIARSNISKDDLLYQEDESTDNPVYYIKLHNVFYQGEWENSLPNGKGWAIYPDGSYLQGNFKKGTVNDQNGFLILKNGAVYKGNIVDSEISGEGVLIDKNYLYKGKWDLGKPHGRGHEQFGKDKGKIYTGDFAYGLKNGSGIYIDTELQERYDGEFKDGLMHGFGLYYVRQALVYKGKFQRGQKVGEGELITEKGKLIGYFENDVVNGKGEFKWNDERRYVGDFKDSKFDGVGTLYMGNGKSCTGQFKDGHPNGAMKFDP